MKKTFAVGARVTPETNYYVSRKKVAAALFSQIIHKHPFCTLSGASQSGKTTLALEMICIFESDFTFL